MPLTLTDFYTPAALADNWTSVYSNQLPYLGQSIFAPQKKTGLQLSWFKGSQGLPVSLTPSSFDAKPTFKDRKGVSKIETEMPFFRRAMLIKEKEQQEIMDIQNSTDPRVGEILQRIFNDNRSLIDDSMVVGERMIWQLLAPSGGDAKIHFAANGVTYDYNYDPSGTWKTSNYTALTGTGMWSDTVNSKPLNDIRTIKRAAQAHNGTILGSMIMSQATFDNLMENAQIKSAILAQNATATIFLDDDMLADFLLRKTGMSVVIYEKLYGDESGNSHAFYPDGYVTFLPLGGAPIGSLWYGTTPEERSARQAAGVQLSIVNTGIAVTVHTTSTAPYNTITTASEIVLPSFERMDSVYVMKVA